VIPRCTPLKKETNGTSAYAGQEAVIKQQAPKAKNFTQARAYRNKPLTEAQETKNKTKSKVRAKVEHPFLWIKRIWGFAKTRYRGLHKNLNRTLMWLLSYNVMKANVQLTGWIRLWGWMNAEKSGATGWIQAGLTIGDGKNGFNWLRYKCSIAFLWEWIKKTDLFRESFTLV